MSFHRNAMLGLTEKWHRDSREETAELGKWYSGRSRIRGQRGSAFSLTDATT